MRNCFITSLYASSNLQENQYSDENYDIDHSKRQDDTHVHGENLINGQR